MVKSKEKLVADVVGHVPQESVDATVEDERYRPSPIAKGGLEIVLRATFNIEDSKRFLLLRLKELIAPLALAMQLLYHKTGLGSKIKI